MHDDAMDKIVNRLDVCQWHPLKVTDAMDKVINTDFEKGVQVETQSVPNRNPIIQVETKQCFVKLVHLDSILLDSTTDVDDNKHETDVIDNIMTPPSFNQDYGHARHDLELHDTQDKPVLTWNTVNQYLYLKLKTRTCI